MDTNETRAFSARLLRDLKTGMVVTIPMTKQGAENGKGGDKVDGDYVWNLEWPEQTDEVK